MSQVAVSFIRLCSATKVIDIRYKLMRMIFIYVDVCFDYLEGTLIPFEEAYGQGEKNDWNNSFERNDALFLQYQQGTNLIGAKCLYRKRSGARFSVNDGTGWEIFYLSAL